MITAVVPRVSFLNRRKVFMARLAPPLALSANKARTACQRFRPALGQPASLLTALHPNEPSRCCQGRPQAVWPEPETTREPGIRDGRSHTRGAACAAAGTTCCDAP